jgi:hypothetical protein
MCAGYKKGYKAETKLNQAAHEISKQKGERFPARFGL